MAQIPYPGEIDGKVQAEQHREENLNMLVIHVQYIQRLYKQYDGYNYILHPQYRTMLSEMRNLNIDNLSHKIYRI